ncbi:hypothetical protein A2631_01015 [Candidatus Daviesbacteria bacterium RIFCSPHIGHO2_01_FULL_44_29]|uniref:S-adenosylmethionine decarboxylase proenzyme n=1 Tax=Candidatus Daviesbacteria bacterium RIFCSPHIGHO2_02_FULL_43_12 TaxID=1797776 RepID=A0A1F5KHL9_9BACT|nr:MAG: hypothetical protein A2631_01015 [Candidatus Daviesbacteria bacterium RIFCSPHIGHO2_01_FULL_44_29]OGE40433.1 MAG: hypothetical protein A3D25_05405 [Candidatus Daviesbacteria bacterium RIFCSPHIGHO2_02_FULL_43_12]OGE40622.1 MAG: hypothetical protein A3E86_04120 [Candidatus Daviesbacteria bacterium RIFCSPHIGHO2_12_FULL_47_45]OGE69705.1 MAG: hypothetical protein A3B55_05920 [Candidatus Daviesbacteria bacterium RIFCSPLOWO2_01_FULL_43_15]
MAAGRFHLIIDIRSIKKEILTDEQRLSNFLVSLPPIIDMSILAGPVIAQGIPENPGLSGFVIIDYSHISVHTFTEHGQAQIDIFSCKDFDQEKAIAATLDYCQVTRDKAVTQVVGWK